MSGKFSKLLDSNSQKKQEFKSKGKLSRLVAASSGDIPIGVEPVKSDVALIQGFRLKKGQWFKARGGSTWKGYDEWGEPKSSRLVSEKKFQFVRKEKHNGRLYLLVITDRGATALLYFGTEPYISPNLDSIKVYPFVIKGVIAPPRKPKTKKRGK